MRYIMLCITVFAVSLGGHAVWALSDNDQPDQASQDSMVSHCTRLRVIDPTTWGDLHLVR